MVLYSVQETCSSLATSPGTIANIATPPVVATPPLSNLATYTFASPSQQFPAPPMPELAVSTSNIPTILSDYSFNFTGIDTFPGFFGDTSDYSLNLNDPFVASLGLGFSNRSYVANSQQGGLDYLLSVPNFNERFDGMAFSAPDGLNLDTLALASSLVSPMTVTTIQQPTNILASALSPTLHSPPTLPSPPTIPSPSTQPLSDVMTTVLPVLPAPILSSSPSQQGVISPATVGVAGLAGRPKRAHKPSLREQRDNAIGRENHNASNTAAPSKNNGKKRGALVANGALKNK